MAAPNTMSLILTLTILLTTYLTYLASVPPNPTPSVSTHHDPIRFYISPSGLLIRRTLNLSLAVTHALLTPTHPPPSSTICPYPTNLNATLFAPTPWTLISLSFITIGSLLRFQAYRNLGKDFTFRVQEPQKLTTSGIYLYVQHPSYTGSFLIFLGNLALFYRVDGVVGCWVAPWIVNLRYLWRAVAGLLIIAGARLTRKRVLAEESLLRKTFGRDWDVWHEKTKRFIPGLF